MIFLPKYKVMFFHVPRTGGRFITSYFTSVTKVIHIGYRHSPVDMSGIKVFDPGIFKFCMLREPAEWYVSYWNLKKPKAEVWEQGALWHPTWEIDLLKTQTFEDYIYTALKLDGFLNRMYRRFVGEGKLMMDYVGDRVTLLEDLRDICKRFKIPFDLDKVKKREHIGETNKLYPPNWEVLKNRINSVENYYFER